MNTPTARPIHTELCLPGLRKPFTILQVSDLHMLAMTDEEAAAMPRHRYDYIQPRIGLFSEGRLYPPECVLPAFGDCARKLGADLILMTGDLMDFPSDANISRLGEFIATSDTPVLYVTGNHDWSYADDYHTPHAEGIHLPRIYALSGTTGSTFVRETDDIVFIAVDNGLERIPAEAEAIYTEVARRARAAGKAVILTMHIPLVAKTLVEDTTRVWRRDICIGPNACGADDAATMSFYRLITESADLAPDLVITGHLHFDHEDVFPNGVPQYVTNIASGGHSRLFTLLPAAALRADPHHTSED